MFNWTCWGLLSRGAFSESSYSCLAFGQKHRLLAITACFGLNKHILALTWFVWVISVANLAKAKNRRAYKAAAATMQSPEASGRTDVNIVYGQTDLVPVHNSCRHTMRGQIWHFHSIIRPSRLQGIDFLQLSKNKPEMSSWGCSSRKNWKALRSLTS